MEIEPRRLAVVVVVLAVVVGVLVWRALPRFERSGALSVRGAPFAPVTCEVLRGRTGIELADARGIRLAVELPPRVLNAFQSTTGDARCTLQVPGEAPVELRACGVLKLRAEGYHGDGKRAAGGHVSLAGAEASGELDFSGCF